MTDNVCKCGEIYRGTYHCCAACHQLERDEMDAKRLRRQLKFEEDIRSYTSGHPPITFEQRMTLIDNALGCAYDPNGHPDIVGCQRLIQFVEELYDNTQQ